MLATTPTPALAKLVQPLDAGYAASLDRIEYLGAMCTVLALRQPLSNIYWLNVADPGYDFGGVIEQTNFVPASEYGGRHLVWETGHNISREGAKQSGMLVVALAAALTVVTWLAILLVG